jgi:uncharacterized protein (TIGR02147 family)
MTKINVFDFKDYKLYLVAILELKSQTQKGQKSKLSQFIGVNPAYLSQILNADTNLSPEQAQATNAFLSHTPQEARYFLNLVLFGRAGTKDLKDYYEQELKEQRQARLILKNRVKSNRTLTETAQAQYYSSWYYAAIHVAVSLAKLRNKEQIALALGLPPLTVNAALEFLVQIGLLKVHGNDYRQGEVNLYLGSDSSFITKHHTNWRMKAIQSLDNIHPDDLHYSGVITCSVEDLAEIREIMVRSIESIRERVKKSKDETLNVYNFDLFSLIKGSLS